jgi:hypothetical protein
VGTNLRHDESLIAPSAKTFTQPVLGFTAVIFPTIIVEGDSAIQGTVDDLYGGCFVFGCAQVVSSEAQSRNLHIGLAKTTQRDRH